jgi:hypothetical protein
MKKILFICGSLNQTTMMHKISKHLQNKYDCWFTPFYADEFIDSLTRKGYLDFSILGGKFREDTEEYLAMNFLKKDYKGLKNNYELVVTCSDLIVPKNIRNKKIILVQEGMTDPKNIFYYLAKYFGLPAYLASTSTTGLSDIYDYFCVASEGYKRMFVKNGCNPRKIKVTGVPNFDDCKRFLNNNFHHKNYVLVCTSDSRETFKYENRKKFIKRALEIANDKLLIFKLHPNEKRERAIEEIKKYAPGSIVFTEGNTNEMIANCDILVTKYSSVVYIGLALGKKVYSAFNLDKLKSLVPLQNNGNSSYRIAQYCEYLLEKSTQEVYGFQNKGYAIPVPEF